MLNLTSRKLDLIIPYVWGVWRHITFSCVKLSFSPCMFKIPKMFSKNWLLPIRSLYEPPKIIPFITFWMMPALTTFSCGLTNHHSVLIIIINHFEFKSVLLLRVSLLCSFHLFGHYLRSWNTYNVICRCPIQKGHQFQKWNLFDSNSAVAVLSIF